MFAFLYLVQSYKYRLCLVTNMFFFAEHTAEGSYNFTSIAGQSLNPDVTDVESDDDDEREMQQQVDLGDKDEDLQILDQAEVGDRKSVV